MIENLLQNLTLNLQKSDEIEASSISVFNLVCRIFELRETHDCLKPLSFKLCLKTFCPFNFHKIEAVRYSFNTLLSKCLAQTEHHLDADDFGQLHTLVVQSIAMETSPLMVKLLYKILEQLVGIFSTFQPITQTITDQEKTEHITQSAYASYLRDDLMQDVKLPAWLIDVEPNFSSFTFYTSENFENVTTDYFEIVFKPANEHEWETFHNQKTDQLTKALAIMLASSKD